MEQMLAPDQCLAHWLCASAGAGKTQGVRLWVENGGRPYAWIQLDASDRDPFRFLEGLFAATMPLMDSEREHPSIFPQGRFSLERHCEFLWEHLLDSLRMPSILVLDDAHLIGPWSRHPALHHLLRHPHPRLHLVVVSRKDPSQAYARELVNQKTRLVAPQAFVWQLPHLRAWLRRRWQIREPEPDLLQALLEISQGNAGVLSLLDIDALRKSGVCLKNAVKQLELASVMEHSLGSQMNGGERQVLSWLACLGSFPEVWLSKLNFPEGVMDRVRSWVHEGSVIMRLDSGTQELRFHPLWAELLRSATPKPDQTLPDLYARIIDACVAEDRPLDAMALARHTQDWPRYWEQLAKEGVRWIERGQTRRLSQALAVIPAKTLSALDGPVVSLLLAADALDREPATAYSLALQAVSQSRQGTFVPSVWAMAIAFAASSVVGGGQSLARLEPIAQALDESIETTWFAELSPDQRLNALKGGVIALLSAATKLRIDKLFEQTHLALGASENVELRAEVLSAMMRVVALHGLAQFFEPVALGLREIQSLAQSPCAQTALENARVSQYLALGLKSECVSAADATLKGYAKDAPSVWKAEVLCIAAFSCLSSGLIARAHRYCKELEVLARPGRSKSASLHWHLHAGALAAHEGTLAQAMAHFELGVKHADDYGYPFMQIVTRCVLMVTKLESEDLKGAQRLLREGDEILRNCDVPFAQRVHAGSLAYFNMKVGSVLQAKQAFERVFDLMRASDSYSLGLDLLPQNQQFLSFALERDIQPDTVETIVRRAPFYPAKRPHPRWPSLFEVQVLGGFELRINGQCARARFASSGSRFAMLTALLWEGRGLDLQRCETELWGYQRDKMRRRRAMQMALRRLREDLGREDAIVELDGVLQLNPELWSFDAWELNTKLQAASTAERSALLTKVERGFVGPTPIPEGMRHRVPQRGGRDFGPAPLLPWIFSRDELC